jgi:hypothetical protein
MLRVSNKRCRQACRGSVMTCWCGSLIGILLERYGGAEVRRMCRAHEAACAVRMNQKHLGCSPGLCAAHAQRPALVGAPLKNAAL